MKVRSYLFEGYRSAIDNGRGHTIITDLPSENYDLGQNSGATALEVSLMSLAGCISTIYALIAHNKKVTIDRIFVELDGVKSDEKGFESVSGEVKVIAEADQEKLEKLLADTMKACPVGKIFHAAGIEEKIQLVKVDSL